MHIHTALSESLINQKKQPVFRLWDEPEESEANLKNTRQTNLCITDTRDWHRMTAVRMK